MDQKKRNPPTVRRGPKQISEILLVFFDDTKTVPVFDFQRISDTVIFDISTFQEDDLLSGKARAGNLMPIAIKPGQFSVRYHPEPKKTPTAAKIFGGKKLKSLF